MCRIVSSSFQPDFFSFHIWMPPSASNLPLLSRFPVFAFAACHLKWKSKCSMFVYFLLYFFWSDEPKSIKMTPPWSCISLESDSIHHLLTPLLVTWHFLLALCKKDNKKQNKTKGVKTKKKNCEICYNAVGDVINFHKDFICNSIINP